MKTILCLLLTVLTMTCKPPAKIEEPKEVTTVLEVPCPEEGDCSTKLLANRTISIKKDGTGKYYPVFDSGTSNIVEFNFSILGPAGTADGDYSETIHFEIPESTKTLNLSNEELGEVNMLFGKHCYCKGEAGYYLINKGNLKVTQTPEAIEVDLSFSVNETSHKVSRIVEKIKK